MCLIKKHWFPKIAWKPINTYKVLYRGSNLKGTYYSTPYEFVRVTFGKCLKSRDSWIWGLLYGVIDGEGVHSYLLSTDIPFLSAGQVVVKSIIPRFSLYWEGTEGDVASTKLLITSDKYYD